MKTILGVKFTHDGGIAVIEGNRLVFATEMEKIANRERYTEIKSLDWVYQALKDKGYSLGDIDVIAVDGWRGSRIYRPFDLRVAPYHEFDVAPPNRIEANARYYFNARKDFPFNYVSYPHMWGHITSALCTSPYEEAYALTWDGGQNARLHYVHNNRVNFIGSVHEIYGVIYGIMGYYFGPYKQPEIYSADLFQGHSLYGGYDKPGKLMSYIAMGKPDPVAIAFLKAQYSILEWPIVNSANRYGWNRNGTLEHTLMRRLVDFQRQEGFSDEDALASVHEFLERLLVERVQALVPKRSPLLFSGGSALNIKWNTALREAGYKVWVPPFPNDAGSAIGVACAEMIHQTNSVEFFWDVYSGPYLKHNAKEIGWKSTQMTPFGVGSFLADNQDQAVVFLYEEAELGPRALGHRSIFMSPARPENKAFLNKIKRREEFRPVAPLVLESEASNWFVPGRPDPYMLFDHHVIEEKKDLVPAIVHLDGTARVQTIKARECRATYEVVKGFFQKTGIPMICNTSANKNGSGFFPDVRSAQEWAEENGVKYVWANGELWSKQ
jgi:carbamoyltransferase